MPDLSKPGSIALAISGDPVVGRALVLLLWGSRYEARFLPASSLLREPGKLKGIRLLLLTPTPQLNTECREALLASLRDRRGPEKMLVLELATTSEEKTREGGGMRDDSWHMVPWPCRTEELEQRIEVALCHYETRGDGAVYLWRTSWQSPYAS